MMKKDYSDRNGFVDFIKFVMALFIMWGHYDYIIGQEFESVSVHKTIASFGHSNLTPIVCVFFFLSGYFAYKYDSGKLDDDNYGLGTYILKKIKRIYPLMIISVFWFCITDLLYRVIYGHFWAGRTVNLSDAVLTLLGVQDLVSPEKHQVNGPLWYVCVLMLCYVVFGLIWKIKIKGEYKYLFFVFVILLSTITLVNETSFRFLKVTLGLMCFFTGICFAAILRYYPNIKKLYFAIPVVAVYILLYAVNQVYGVDLLGNRYVAVITTFAPGIIIMGESSFFKKIFNNAFFGFCGNISYPIYLFHIPAFVTMGLLFKDGIKYDSYITMVLTALFVIAVGFVADRFCTAFLKK